jgi:hypothetical protein
MRRLERRRRSGYATPSRSRHRRTAAAPRSVDAELLDQLLDPLHRRRREAQRRLDELARRRGAMSTVERPAASQSLRAQAVQLRSELARLSLIESLAIGILRPHASCDRPGRRSPTHNS